jgi:hypothetical protein
VTTVMVCDQWPLSILDDVRGGHLDWYRTKGSAQNAQCLFELVQGLPTGMSVAEHFGGIGESSIVFQNVLKPRSHYVSDLDPDCVSQLRSALPPSVTVRQANAHDSMRMIEAEFVSLDFAYFTVRYHRNWPWVEVFEKKPKYVEFADCAKRRIGLHRDVYSEIFGTKIMDYEDYTEAYSKFFEKNYGYRIVRTVSRTYSYHLLGAEGSFWVKK